MDLIISFLKVQCHFAVRTLGVMGDPPAEFGHIVGDVLDQLVQEVTSLDAPLTPGALDCGDELPVGILALLTRDLVSAVDALAKAEVEPHILL